MRPSAALEHKRLVVRETANRFRTANPRVFGSTLHGTDHDGSDLDLLVDALPGTTLFDLGGLQSELEMLLGVRVDVLTPADLPASFRDQVLAEALPVLTRTAWPIGSVTSRKPRTMRAASCKAWTGRHSRPICAPSVPWS